MTKHTVTILLTLVAICLVLNEINRGRTAKTRQITNIPKESISSSPTTGKGAENSTGIQGDTPEMKLALRLKEINAVMYSSEKCVYCKKQAQLFGEKAFALISVVNCTDEPRKCGEKRISTTPSWEINGKIYPSLRPLDEISEIANKN
ncbi:hypothetical protein K9N68_37375 (plasmid) [Kovacikia minuta CCNUW1]|uniref:hypothetical protein n=1 Tax=Kovacikia minuta TaxID=2931930 RepID=UPI001CCB5B1B|nr:hypothetical protein [Kovacikia minuta]UBF29885.1 hypothetical protein K9N68_37375 [Kovacikia minuta CCNUW1]